MSEPRQSCEWKPGRGQVACPHPASKSRFCIAHDPHNPANIEDLRALFKAIVNDPDTESIDCRGWRFPADFAAPGISLYQCGVTFERKVFFQGALFEGDVYFEQSQFSEAWFSRAQFNGFAYFNQTVYLRKAAFGDAQFSAHCEFRSADFLAHAIFNETTFEEEALFDGARFRKGAQFSHSVFLNQAMFSNAILEGAQSLFTGTQFNCGIVLNDAHLTGHVMFTSAVLRGHSFLHNTVFEGDVEFYGVRFEGPTWFKAARFIGSTWFDQCDFSALCRLDECSYAGVTYFSVAPARRNLVLFRKSDVGKIRFSGSDLRYVDFDQVQWGIRQGRLILSDEPAAASLKNKLRSEIRRLRLLQRLRRTAKEARIISVSKAERQVGSAESLLNGPKRATIPTTTFDSFVKYLRTRFKQRCRRRAVEIVKVHDVRRVYRQLRKNFDEVQDYEVSGACHISEGSMALRLSPPILRQFSLNSLYRFASEYGENYHRAGLVLAVVLFTFLLGFWLFPPDFAVTPAELGSVPSHLSLKQAIWLTLHAARPFANLGFKHDSAHFWLAFAEGSIVPTQIALLVLAINRRFKRA